MVDDEEVDTDESDDNLAQLTKTGQIPDALLKDIMAEAGHYMTLYNYNPSSLNQLFHLFIQCLVRNWFL